MNKISFLFSTMLIYSICIGAHDSILVTTIPKSGSHLLNRTVELLTGKTRMYSLPKSSEALTTYYLREYFPTIDQLSSIFPLKKNIYMMKHLFHTDTYEAYIKENAIKLLFIIRDPRDVLISRVHYLKDGKRPKFMFKNLPFEQLLTALIGKKDDPHFGMKSWIEEYATNPNSLCNVAQLYHDFLPWRKTNFCYTTHFEKLVGSKGGGCNKLQAQEIRNIASHLGKTVSLDEAAKIGSKLFGHAGTFRKGQIGSWKKYFTPAHKKQFKAVAGDLLIDLGYETDMNW